MCPGYTLESQEHIVFRGDVGLDSEPSDHLPSVAKTPCPPAHVLSEVTSLQSPQPGSFSVVRSPLPLRLLPGLLVSVPHFSFSPSPHSLMICLSLNGPAAGAGSFPQGSRVLVGRRVLAPRGHSCWPVLSLLPPSCSPQACSSPRCPSLVPFLAGITAGSPFLQEEKEVPSPPFVSRSPHPLPTFPRTSPWKPIYFQRR